MSKRETPWKSGKPPLALIAGPTASGKTALGVALAQALARRGTPGIVINADSAQIYRDLAVLSARPTADETDNVPHRLFGAWDGAAACSAADWSAAARREIENAHLAGQVPILVGGTGLYMRVLLEGIAPVPAIDPAIRQAVRALPQDTARTALEAEDPEAAERLAPADRTRTLRALEVVRSTGRPLAAWQEEKVGGIAADIALHALVLLPDRDKLYQRCDRRFPDMLESGAIAEVQALLARELDPALPVMRAIGVPEIAAMLRGEASREATIVAGATATRQYAKRQYTWFRNQPPPDWKRAREPPDIERWAESISGMDR